MNNNSTVKFSEIKNFVENNPHASAKDLLQKIINSNDTASKGELERQRKCKEWYAALAGRYFIIKFNEASSIVVKIENAMTEIDSVEQPLYDIICDRNRLEVTSYNRRVNRLWFGNPYEVNRTLKDQIVEVDRDYFEKIGDMYRHVREIFNATIK